ncbi:RelA/SpoT family protein [Hydromonas duriensis]|uniref:GTP pyrophosphokinase n=1 Tax=Hydromonas duriensis TaxID=1527608 RepID=A0A4V3DK26_9BURK|nr:bifunctional (p)ppGpp synthetase/guanosine-3',5'-bis(diphosphate) 3'-pyrophosphohydrolase [Hydromonas duriensis]TDR32396.1 (p)ppGpp synthetase I SpoT/RelA [Hydromonas duriensis]
MPSKIKPVDSKIDIQFTSVDDARASAQERYEHRLLSSGEDMFAHAVGMSEILSRLDVADDMHISAYLFGWLQGEYTTEEREHIVETLKAQWGAEQAQRVQNLYALMHMGARAKVQHAHSDKNTDADMQAQIERVRKMLLAMAHDIRVVILRLVSRLQTLRYYAKNKITCPEDIAKETLLLYSPLANRLGVWQIKWELEDLAFRFAEPQTYRDISAWLDEKRAERESFVSASIAALEQALALQQINAQISGRPKHIYSIYNKMRGKQLQFADLYDIRAFRIIVADVKDCYGVLGVLHHLWQPIPKEFDDYIARPKPNGYQSLHTVVVGDDGRPIEVQIRTQEMHQFAEYGVAAHWRYKEGGFKQKSGKADISTEQANYDEQIAWVRQLISWQSDLTHALAGQGKAFKLQDPHIYVLTPDARVIELPRDSTPIDFAYHVHTNLGHLCRGAKVNGQMVPLTTKLQTGQTVNIIAAKQGGPSRDWLREGFTNSPRAKSKVRAWFNAQATADYIAQGRTVFEKELQRLSKTSVKHEDIAQGLGFTKTEECYLAFGREEMTAHNLEELFKSQAPAEPPVAVEDHNWVSTQANKSEVGKGGVLVVGLDDLMTQLAKCCKPAPPDAIAGFVTRGKGISIHRLECDNFQHMQFQHSERVLSCTWAERAGMRYAVDVLVYAQESVDLMKDITDVLAREKILISGLRTVRQGMASARCQLTFSLEVESTTQLQKALSALRQVTGVQQVERL